MFHADLDPLQARREALHRRPRSRDLRIHRGRSRHRVRRRIVQGRRADAIARPGAGAARHLLPDPRCRVHVHPRHRDQALHPARLEPIRSKPTYTAEQKRHILERPTAAETLERYLHTRYVGQKRFSGEGGDTMTPMLDRLIEKAGAAGVQETVIGMAHRGRLNVLVNTLGKMPRGPLLRVRGQVHARTFRRRRQVPPGLRPTSSRRAARWTSRSRSIRRTSRR